MYYNLIKSNINNLNSDMTLNFLKNNNIVVSKEESVFLTNLVKTNWEDLYNKNYSKVFEIISKKLDKDTYEKIKALYFKTINQYL